MEEMTETMPLRFEGRKSREPHEPYMVFVAGAWTFKVLKSWQKDNRKIAARWFCAVSSPMTYGHDELGDVYVWDIIREANAELVEVDGHPPTEDEIGSWMALRAGVNPPPSFG